MYSDLTEWAEDTGKIQITPVSSAYQMTQNVEKEESIRCGRSQAWEKGSMPQGKQHQYKMIKGVMKEGKYRLSRRSAKKDYILW